MYAHDGKVDLEWSTTALTRQTWSWINPLLTLAQKKGDLDLKDIPRPDHIVRTKNLVQSWNKAKQEGHLGLSLIRAYGLRLATQWTAIIIRCIVGIGPFWAMLHIVQILEQRDRGEEEGMARKLWGLVLIMGFFTFAEQVSIVMFLWSRPLEQYPLTLGSG